MLPSHVFPLDGLSPGGPDDSLAVRIDFDTTTLVKAIIIQRCGDTNLKKFRFQYDNHSEMEFDISECDQRLCKVVIKEPLAALSVTIGNLEWSPSLPHCLRFEFLGCIKVDCIQPYCTDDCDLTMLRSENALEIAKSHTALMPARSICELDIPEKDDMFITFILLGFNSEEQIADGGLLEINEPENLEEFPLGSEIPPVFVSSSSTVYFRILTGISTDHPNVTVTYGYTDKPGCHHGYEDDENTKCKTSSGIIMSENYFNGYPDGVHHTWTLITRLWTRVILSFIEIDAYSADGDCLEDDYVNVSFTDQITVLCEVPGKSAVVESSGNWMTVTFHSDPQDNGQQTGFLAEYRTELLKPEYSKSVDNASFRCEDEWEIFQGSCYNLFRNSEDITWKDAEAKCKDEQGHLVSIRDEDEMTFIHFMISSTELNSTEINAYIGLGNREVYGVFRWTDGTPMSYTAWAKKNDQEPAGTTDTQPDGASLEGCVKLVLNTDLLTDLSLDLWHDVACAAEDTNEFICERAAERIGGSPVDAQLPLYIADAEHDRCGSGLFHCSSGECISEVFICDGKDDCIDGSDENNCAEDDKCLDNQFQCTDGACIASAFFCDTIPHCLDNSDETACNYPECEENEIPCASKQCIEDSKRCDFIRQCHDGSDEIGCEKENYNVDVFQCYDGTLLPKEVHCDGMIDCIGNTHEDERNCPNLDELEEREFYCPSGDLDGVPFKCMYDFNSYGLIKGCRNVDHLKDCGNETCPENSMRCPGSYCIPLKYRCDNKKDCPYGEDENECDDFICPPGTYRCNSKSGKGLCISPDHVCDDVIDCPDRDDELLCYECPDGCDCQDLSYSCNLTVDVSLQLPRQLRKLSLTLLNETTENSTRVLRPLDNDPEGIDFIPSKWPNLIYLDISHSEISEVKPDAFANNRNVRHLNLHNNKIRELHEGSFTGLEQLRFMNLSGNNLREIHSGTFSNLDKLQELDIRGNEEIAYAEESQRAIFAGLENFKLYTDKYIFCCMAKIDDANCDAPRDQFSSCTDLMESIILRALIWILGFSAFIGNVFVIGYRLIVGRKERKKNNVQASLITNLAISDFLMGVYMLTIASADVNFRGTYIYQADYWTSSTLCQLTGMVSVISSEASVFLVMMISLDRCFHVVAPFKRGLHMSQRSSHIIETAIWALSFLLGLLPIVIPSYFKDEFYGASGVCLALPLTTDRPAGWHYSISIFIGANFMCFLVTFLCYVAIFMSVKTSQRQVAKSSAAVGREDKRLKEEIKLATKMALIVGTDLICWMPIIIMGLLSAGGTSLPAQVYAWTAVIILPINSSLNPYLYTISTVHSQHLNKLRLKQEAADTKTRESVNSELTTSLITPFTSLPSPLPQRMRTWLKCFSRDLTKEELETIERDVVEAVSSMRSEGVKVDEFLHVDNLAIQTNNAGKISQAFIVLDAPLPLANGKSKLIDDDEKPEANSPMTRNLVKLQTMFDRVAIRKTTNKL
ncbi:G-protein coupled receptor GRL101-like [Lytechinus variegatus]|uniref:G-protein coupled receptor GRL101-like n=1 Tax=Lytechinus variegatus TaxID=7654 RepID=UPI001BB0E655|nr:G-protein coupled receptor GRL101-like [Lytechinus variegatus]